MKDSLGREPRWNADRCAPGDPGAAAPVRRGRIPIASVGVSPPMFFSFVLSVRHCHAEASLANASTGICLLELCMDHRHRRPKDAVLRTTMPGGDDSESGVTVPWHSSGAQTHRENEILFPSRPRAQRVVGRGAGGLRPPCFFNQRRCEASAMGGGNLLSSPPTPAHFTSVKFADPPHRKRGEGKIGDHAARMVRHCERQRSNPV
jgi:hypothetical protein